MKPKNPNKKQKSKIEMIVASELSCVFSDVGESIMLSKLGIDRKQHAGELDIYLPKYNIGVEVDGGHYHKGPKKLEGDNRKNKELNKQNILLFRLRDKRLEDLKDCINVRMDDNNFRQSYIQDLIRSIMETIALDDGDFTRAKNYLALSEYSDYERITANINKYCSMEQENPISKTHPEVAAEWDLNNIGTPNDYTAYSHHVAKFICSKNPEHKWSAAIGKRCVKNEERKNGGSGCPVCAGKTANPENCLAATHPEVAAQIDEEKNIGICFSDGTQVTIHNIKAGSSIKLWHICKEHSHSYYQVVHSRTQGWAGCEFCLDAKQGTKRLLIERPDLKDAWCFERNKYILDSHGIPINPYTIGCSNQTRVWWWCSRHEDYFLQRIDHRVKSPRPCNNKHDIEYATPAA